MTEMIEPANTMEEEQKMSDMNVPSDVKSVEVATADVTVDALNQEGKLTLNAEGNTTALPNAEPNFTKRSLDTAIIKKRDTMRTRAEEDEDNIDGLRVTFLENKRAMERGA